MKVFLGCLNAVTRASGPDIQEYPPSLDTGIPAIPSRSLEACSGGKLMIWFCRARILSRDPENAVDRWKAPWTPPRSEAVRASPKQPTKTSRSWRRPWSNGECGSWTKPTPVGLERRKHGRHVCPPHNTVTVALSANKNGLPRCQTDDVTASRCASSQAAVQE